MAAGYEKHVVVGYYFMSQYADVLVSGKIKAAPIAYNPKIWHLLRIYLTIIFD